jgi:uncharacterized membrane protein YgcG
MDSEWAGSTKRPDAAPAVAGWLPEWVRGEVYGRGAPVKGTRNTVVCKQCKKAKARCDKGRPCRRCLYNGKQDECIADSGGQASSRAAGSLAAPAQKQEPPLIAPRPSADEAGAGGRTARDRGVPDEAGAGGRTARDRGVLGGVQQSPRGAAGEEYLEVSVPDLQVQSVSPALARRYRFRFAGPEGTSLLLWVQKNSHADVLDAIASSAATSQATGMGSCAGIVKMVILRYDFSEIHECSLNVKACGIRCVRLHIVWHDSVERWEQAMLATGGVLPHPLAQRIRHLMSASMANRVFTFDELSSSECVSDLAEAFLKRGGGTHGQDVGEVSFMGKMFKKYLSSEESRLALLKWSGVRSVSKLATRMLQFQYALQEPEGGQGGGRGGSGEGGGSFTGGAYSSPSCSSALPLPTLQIRVRMKFPGFLGGFTTPWWAGIECSMTGTPGDSYAAGWE